MKKKLSLLVMGACIISLVTGCSSGTYSKYVKLGKYKGLELTKIKSEVTDDMIPDEIELILEENMKRTSITDRAAQEGDEVNIDFKGTIDGKSFEDGESEDFELIIGDGYMLEDFEAGIVGMKVSETKNIEVTFTEDYDDDELSGKKAVFEITLNSISEVTIPEYNDAFVAEISEFKTTAEYEANLKEELFQSQEESNLYTAGEDALLKVIENSTFNGYPQELYDQCKVENEQSNTELAEIFGVDIADLDLGEEDNEAAIMDMVHSKMIVTVIAEKEKLEVSDEECESYMQENYEDYGFDSAADFEADYTKEGIKEELLVNKVMNFLIDNATIHEVSEDEYYGDEYDDEYEEESEDYEEFEEDAISDSLEEDIISETLELNTIE